MSSVSGAPGGGLPGSWLYQGVHIIQQLQIVVGARRQWLPRPAPRAIRPGAAAGARGALSPCISVSGAPWCPDGARLLFWRVCGLRTGCFLRCDRRSRGGCGWCLGVGAWVRRGAAAGVCIHRCGWWWVGDASGLPCVCLRSWLLRFPSSVLPASMSCWQILTPMVPGGPIPNLLRSSSSSVL